MTHFVYIYQHDDLGGAELRLSLRSLQANFHPDDGQISVTIVGDKPEWMRPDLYVPRENVSESKLVCIADKVLTGCEALQGESEIICMEDDYIVLDHVTSSPLVYWGDLREHREVVTRVHGNEHWYSEGFRATEIYLAAYVEPLSWELHRPFPVEPEHVKASLAHLIRARYPVLWRSVYAADVGLTGWKGVDGRYSGVTKGRHGVPFASLDDVIPHHVAKEFSTPSRWEA